MKIDTKRTWVFLVFLSAALCLLYVNAIVWLVGIWWTDRSYSHGFFVIPIALYMAWVKREQFAVLPVEPQKVIGGLIVLGSVFLFWIGRVGMFAQAEALSLLIILPGLVLFVWGWHYLKAFALPLVYLQFMVPWMDEFIDHVHRPFQLISAGIGSTILQWLGYTVYRNNVYIELPNLSFYVAKACSGVNFFVAVIAIGLPLVYMTQKNWVRGGVVLTLGVCITILSNGVRVALAGVMGSNYGVDMLHGPSHIFRGFFVAQVGWVGIFLVNWAAMKISFQDQYGLPNL